MFRATTFLVITFSLLLFSCKRETDWLRYEDEASGFSIDYPKKWTRLTQEEVNQSEDRGREMVEKVVGDSVPVLHRNLLDVRKNMLTSFGSTFQEFDQETEGPYAIIQEQTFGTLIQSLEEGGAHLQYYIGKIQIDELSFDELAITLYTDKSKTRELMHMHMYDRFFDNRFALSLTLTYTNAKEKEMLMQMLESASFKYRN